MEKLQMVTAPPMLLFLPHPFPNLSPKFSPSPSPLSLPRLHRTNPSLPPPHASLSQPDDAAVARSAIHRIAEKLRSLGFLDNSSPSTSDRPLTGPGSAGEIFIPIPKDLPKHRVGYSIDTSWSTPENPVPLPGSGATLCKQHEHWRERMRPRPWGPDKAPSIAELTLPPEELKRLRTEGIRLQKRLKVGKAGITEGIVNGIHERWRRAELVKIRCEDLCRMNMKRTHEILERKTGGLVVWRSGSIIILYRGANYQYPYFYQGSTGEIPDSSSEEPNMSEDGRIKKEKTSCSTISTNSSAESPGISIQSSSIVIGVGSPKKVRFQLPGEVQAEEEADRLLEGLGPRFTDWWGSDPLPIDADLLPAAVPGFRKPFRLLPFGVQPKLTDREMTILRRLGRPLPCHFALGRNRNLQGLAVSMIKVWEKCEITKIAVKRGVQNTNSELMAEELKRLTGGTLLSRDREFIVFYRGKDFLPPAVSSAIEQRRKYELAQLKKNTNKNTNNQTKPAWRPGNANNQTMPAYERGTELPAFASDRHEVTESKMPSVQRKTPKSGTSAVDKLDAKLSLALEKKEKAEQLLAELEKSTKSPTMEPDREAISEEERYMLRKVGLRMGPFLLLGRRGVFDGTIENMHLHWKYRELVKIIAKGQSIEDAQITARTLEAESGGILVAVERVTKGYAIIVYRGKNYRRPPLLRPNTLINKKEAMKRSIEAQRFQSLKLHVLSLSRNIDHLKQKLVKVDAITDSEQLARLGRSADMIEEVHKEEAELSLSHEQGQALGAIQEVSHCSVENGEVGLVEWSPDAKVAKRGCDTEMRYTSYDTATHTESFMESVAPPSTRNGASDISDEEATDESCEKSQMMPNSSVYVDELKTDSGMQVPFKAAPLSNRERLFLRKQALKMRKRPVIAVGRNNVITGVAKTINAHFCKHPLAIVNIKGRAKGTSAQEVIFELEQATGSVLVSQEPSKVILYRGWGAGESAGGGKERDGSKRTTVGKDVVSPQLMAAIRLECGLQSS